jgi:hypothetical protein
MRSAITIYRALKSKRDNKKPFTVRIGCVSLHSELIINFMEQRAKIPFLC